MKFKTILIALIALVVGIVISPKLTNSPSTSLGNINPPRKYAANVAWSSIPFWPGPKKAWGKIATKTSGVEMIFGGPNDGDSSKQIEEIEHLIAQKVDGIALFPGDPKPLIPVINKATALGIPVVTVFVDVPESERLTFIGGSEEVSGRSVAKQILNDFPEIKKQKTEVLISYVKPGIDTQEKRMKGIEEVLKEYDQTISIVDRVEDEIDETKGAEAIRAAFIRHPNIKVIFGLDSRSAIGAISAMKELGKRPGEVIITGWDSDADVLKAIESGWVQLTPALHASVMFNLCFAMLEAHHQGYLYPDAKPGSTPNPWIVPKKIEVPLTLVTKSNVISFLNEALP
jgi:ribose transport system substrate-binding protein